MGCRPSRNSHGRIADTTSEYNRCYIKELEKTRRKQKKSFRGGRRRTPTYNAFSSTTKCYERDEGASKITVRLSTDGSMLEIEQYDIDFTPEYAYESETTQEDRGLEMRPIGGASTSVDRFRNSRFSYGRSGSEPLLLTDSRMTRSSNVCKTGDTEIVGSRTCDTRVPNSPDISEDSINGATSNGNTRDVTPSIVAANVHKEETLKYERGTMFTNNSEDLGINNLSSMSDDIQAGAPANKESKPPDNELNFNHIGYEQEIAESSIKDRQEFYDCHQSILENKSYNDYQECGLNTCICHKEIFDIKSKSSDGATCHCFLENFDKVNCIEDACLRQEHSDKEMYSILTDGSVFEIVPRNTTKYFNSGEQSPTNCNAVIESDTSDFTRKHKHRNRGQINTDRKRHNLIENQNACDRFLSYCFVCEKDKWESDKSVCSYINNKCHTVMSANNPDLEMDSNANVCCCRRYSSQENQINIPNSNRNVIDNKYSALAADDKISLSPQSDKTGSFQNVTNTHHPTNAENPIISRIDFSENILCKDLLGRQTFSTNGPDAFFSDNANCPGSSQKSMHAHAPKKCLENLCLMNMKKYNCIVHTRSAREKSKIKTDKFASVTMTTNDVAETTHPNDGQLRCYPVVNSIEETEFSRNWDTSNCCHEHTDITDQDIYHDACGCQKCTYVTTTSQFDSKSAGSDHVTTGSNISLKNIENQNLTRPICKIGCCDCESNVTGDIWRYNHIVENNDDDDNDFDSDDSISSDDYRDDEYVDAMETTYV